MYTQDLNNALMYESERRRDELKTAQDCCRVNQLLGKRPAPQTPHLLVALFNLLVMALPLLRKH